MAGSLLALFWAIIALIGALAGFGFVLAVSGGRS